VWVVWVVWVALEVSVGLAALVALAGLAESVVLVAQAESVALAALAAQAVLVVLAALAGLVVPSPKGLAGRGLTTLRIEAARPMPTSGPRTSLVGPPGVRGSEAPEPAIGRPAWVRDSEVRA
jgi:hypothetical protein